MSPSTPDGGHDSPPPPGFFWAVVFPFAMYAVTPVAFGLIGAVLARLGRSNLVVGTLETPYALACLVALAAVGVVFLLDGIVGRRARATFLGMSSLLATGSAYAFRCDDTGADVLHHLLLQAGAAGLVIVACTGLVVLCDAVRRDL